MPKFHAYHPRSYISGIRNVTRGLSARTKIIESLEEGKRLRAMELTKKTGLTMPCVTHHLRLLTKRKIVASTKISRSRTYILTTYGQERLC